VYSHGYIATSSPGLEAKFKKAGLGPDPDSVAWLLSHGYALAASLYSKQGWAVQSAFTNQVALVDLFKRRFGSPRQVIAWGASMGGLISVGLAEQYPTRFSGALPMCGAVAGSLPNFDTGLDAEYVIKTLLAPSSALQLSYVSNPARDRAILTHVIQTAQTSASGRARLALAAAMLDLPNDRGGEEQQQQWLDEYWVPVLTFGAAQVEQLSGGNPTSNAEINYAALLNRSADRGEVETLYHHAEISLVKDLTALAGGPRVSPASKAVAYYTRYYSPTGHLTVPVLTLHDTADPRAVVEQERVYADRVRTADASRLLRQLFVHRSDHCNFTPAEELAAVRALVVRLNTSHWSKLGSTELDRAAQALGPDLNRMSAPAPPAFITFAAPPLPRS
jgi:pimeloyl-ACP methyl ester carboxylesterase